MTIENCRVFGSSDGIYIGGSANRIEFCNVRTFCDVCKEKIATEYFTPQDKEFNHLFRRSIYKNYHPWEIHIIGTCEECLKKV